MAVLRSTRAGTDRLVPSFERCDFGLEQRDEVGTLLGEFRLALPVLLQFLPHERGGANMRHYAMSAARLRTCALHGYGHEPAAFAFLLECQKRTSQ